MFCIHARVSNAEFIKLVDKNIRPLAKLCILLFFSSRLINSIIHVHDFSSKILYFFVSVGDEEVVHQEEEVVSREAVGVGWSEDEVGGAGGGVRDTLKKPWTIN